MESNIVNWLRRHAELYEGDPAMLPSEATNLREAADQIDRLRAELAAAIKERDEARREACELDAIIRWHLAHPKQIISRGDVVKLLPEIAAERGWDCFKEGGGA